jgi:photosystem I P700 chlorophyll a apoprotein A1
MFSTAGFSDLFSNYGITVMNVDLCSSDFLVYHVNTFTIHVTVLIMIKGILYARSSRLVVDKVKLGYRYPCDGPGRGGSCQISPFDHAFLYIFWIYNSAAVIIFYLYWKFSSDLIGYVYSAAGVSHKSGSSDFA